MGGDVATFIDDRRKDVEQGASDATNVARDVADGLSNATGGASDFNLLTQLNLRGSDNLNDFNNTVSTVRRTLSGEKARDEANAAADMQDQAQRDAEAALRHQKRLEENAAQFRKQKNTQLIAQLFSGGRGGTLLNGTTGLGTGSGDLLGGNSMGGKTLMGK